MNKKEKNQRFFPDSKSTLFLAKNRRGQFYLIAAVIIIALIITFFTISNYIIKKDSVKLYDLGKELGIESQNVLDYGTYSSKDEAGMKSLITNFITKYHEYSGKDKNLYFLFGDKTAINVVAYQDFAPEAVLVQIGEGTPTPLTKIGEAQEFPNTEKSSKVVITIEGVEYEFKLGNGENFYFVISQEIKGEKHVVTSNS